MLSVWDYGYGWDECHPIYSSYMYMYLLSTSTSYKWPGLEG